MMNKATKIWLIAAASLTLLGCVIFGGVLAMAGWDFTKLSTDKYETNSYEITEAYESISIVTNTADVVLAVSEDEGCSVECYEQKKVKHSVTVKDGTLVIDVVDERKWYEHIGIGLGTSKITVRLPQGEHGALSIRSKTGDVEIPKDLTFESIHVTESTGHVTNYASAKGEIQIKTTTGSITAEGISAHSLALSVTTGKVSVSDAVCAGNVTVEVSTGKATLTDITCKSLISDGDTGDITLKNVIAAERFSIERDTGDVTLDACDAAELEIETDTGDVTGTLLSEKIFIVESDTGRRDVPETTSGGKCKISTDTGDIKIAIAPVS